MRVLMANFRYFVSAGPERYMFGVSDALAARNHEVIPFSVDYDRNVATPYAKYFAPPLGRRDEVYFRDHKKSVTALKRTLVRTFYDPDVARRIERLVNDTRPNIAYVLHYLRKLSPALLVGLKRAGLPIVVRISDYMMMCPQAHFLRDSKPCVDCLQQRSLLPSVRHRCVQNSLAASIVNAAAARYHEWKDYFGLIDRFVVTNEFMLQRMVEAGYSRQKLCLIPTFVNTDLFAPIEGVSRDYIAYVGRTEHIKGVHVLLDGFAILRKDYPEVTWRLKIAGTGTPVYADSLRAQAAALNIDEDTEFLGDIDSAGVVDLLGSAAVQVVPSLWFENLPNSLLEGYACGVPVVASDIGSLRDMVINGKTGLKFEPNNPRSMANALKQMWDRRQDLEAMRKDVRAHALATYGKVEHVNRLEALFAQLL